MYPVGATIRFKKGIRFVVQVSTAGLLAKTRRCHTAVLHPKKHLQVYMLEMFLESVLSSLKPKKLQAIDL